MTLPGSRAGLALDVPLARALGARLLDPDDPSAGVAFDVGELAGNGAGGAHAAALGVLLELAGYLAVLPQLGPTEHAVTHASATQLVRAAPLGATVVARGTAEPRTGRLAFVSVVARTVAGTVARVQLTKSIVRTDQAAVRTGSAGSTDA